MATTRCMPASGPHHHHTDSPCLSPHPFFMLWCGRRDARQLCVCVRVCATPCCIHHSAFSAHICVLIVLEAHGCPLLPLLFFFLSPPPSCGGEGEQGGRKQSSHAERSRASRWAGSEMTITNLAARWHAMCCWMRMQSTRSTTQVRLLPPRRPLHLLLITAFPFPLSLSMTHRNEEGECTTMQQS